MEPGNVFILFAVLLALPVLYRIALCVLVLAVFCSAVVSAIGLFFDGPDFVHGVGMCP